MTLTFFAPGIPQPKGSTKSFRHPKSGAIITTSDNPKLKPWQGTVALAARAAGAKVTTGPVAVEVEFRLPRPKGHYGKRGLLPSAPTYPTRKPDADKLLRGIFDALSGVAWIDDAQVVSGGWRKVYADGECGAMVTVTALVTKAREEAA